MRDHPPWSQGGGRNRCGAACRASDSWKGPVAAPLAAQTSRAPWSCAPRRAATGDPTLRFCVPALLPAPFDLVHDYQWIPLVVLSHPDHMAAEEVSPPGAEVLRPAHLAEPAMLR